MNNEQPLFDQLGRNYLPWADVDEIVEWAHRRRREDHLSPSGLVIVFDFDGVLAIPYSQPEVLFAGTLALLRELRGMGHTILVSSFNPRAYAVLKPLVEEGVISAIRAGSCVRWWEEAHGGVYKDEAHRVHMEKRLHIASMLESELSEMDVNHLLFIDDDLRNIENVATAAALSGRKASFPVTTQHVPWYAGVGWATMSAFLATYKAEEF